MTIAKPWVREARSDILVAGLRGAVVGVGLAAVHAVYRRGV